MPPVDSQSGLSLPRLPHEQPTQLLNPAAWRGLGQLRCLRLLMLGHVPTDAGLPEGGRVLPRIAGITRLELCSAFGGRAEYAVTYTIAEDPLLWQEQVRSGGGGSVGEVGRPAALCGAGQLPVVMTSKYTAGGGKHYVAVCGIQGVNQERGCLCLPGGGVRKSISVRVCSMGLVLAFARLTELRWDTLQVDRAALIAASLGVVKTVPKLGCVL